MWQLWGAKALISLYILNVWSHNAMTGLLYFVDLQRVSSCLHVIMTFFTLYENTPIQIYWNFTTKKGKFSDKKFWYFSYSCSKHSLEPPRRGGSNEYPQSMFWSRNQNNNVYPCKPQFYYIKVGFKGPKWYRYVFVMSYSGPDRHKQTM